jgi:hypothetical protein
VTYQIASNHCYVELENGRQVALAVVGLDPNAIAADKYRRCFYAVSLVGFDKTMNGFNAVLL